MNENKFYLGTKTSIKIKLKVTKLHKNFNGGQFSRGIFPGAIFWGSIFREYFSPGHFSEKLIPKVCFTKNGICPLFSNIIRVRY